MKNFTLFTALAATCLVAGCKPSSPTAASVPTPSPLPSGRTLYVNGAGADSNNGLSESAAFRTLAQAALKVQPGDTVLIGDGLYTDADRPGGQLLNLKINGKPGLWITWKTQPGAQPDIRPIGWNGINIAASYQIIDGLTVTGNNEGLTLQEARADAEKPIPDAKFNTNGITVGGRENAPDNKPHHIIIRHCIVSKMPGGGITLLEGDYITVEDNIVFDNCWLMRYGGSGITSLGDWAFDNKPGYHKIVQRNLVWNNRTNVQWVKIGKLSDGNGILFDVTDQEGEGATNPDADAAIKKTATAAPTATASATATATPAPKPSGTPKPPRPEWRNRALIANNISAFNGGSGIHTFRTRHVDIINNTTYSNGHNVGYPELFSNRCVDVNIYNNIIIPRPGGKVTANNRNTDVRWDYNIYPLPQSTASKPTEIVTGPHDIVADPQIVKFADDLRNADFHLQSGSPALDSGTDEVPQAGDHDNRPRPAGKARDRGAFEQ